MLNNHRLRKRLKTSKYGISFRDRLNDFYQNGSGRNFLLKRKITKLKDCTNSFQVEVELKNISKSTKFINSVVIADFTLPKTLGSFVDVLYNEWTQSGSCKILKEIKKTERSDYIMMRDQNPFSFLEEYGYLKGSLISEWFSRMSFEKIHIMVGALTTSNQYTVIYLKNDGGLIKVRVVCQFDEIELPVGEKLKTEKVVFMWDKNSGLENKFAKLVSKKMKLKNVPREINGICCAYYAQGNKVNEEYVMNTLRKIDEKKNAGHLVNTDTILIDAGYCEFGDWLNYKNQFPKGMKYIASEIRSRGLKAGIWIAPIIATINSQLYQTHKNWFIQGFEGRKTQPFDFIDSLSLMILDPTLAEVKNYLGQVFKQYYNWGFRVFKIDFVYPLGFTTDFSRNVTRAKALTELLDVIKDSVGKDAVFLSAISQLSPLVGYIDFVRTGIDTTSPLSYGFPVFRGVVNNYMLKKNIESFKGRNFLNGKVWNADIDCLVLNQNTGLDKNLIIEQQILMNQSNSRWVGDYIQNLNEEMIGYGLI